MNMNSDPYADLSHLCGIAAFSLPPFPLLLSLPPPPPWPAADHFGPIPHHLLSRYLCYDTPSPELLSTSSLPNSPPATATATHPSPEPLLLHSPSLCPCPNYDSPPDITESLANVASSPPPPFNNHGDSVTAAAAAAHPPSETLLHESLISCNRDSPRHMDSPVHQREILPPCVVNYQDTLCFTPERETCSYSASLGVGVSDDENRIPSLLPPSGSLCDSSYVLAQYLVSVMKDSGFSGWYGKRLPSLIRKLALWRKDVILDGKECEKIASFVWENSLQEEPSRKKQRKKQEAKSKGVASSVYFTRSKSANPNFMKRI